VRAATLSILLLVSLLSVAGAPAPSSTPVPTPEPTPPVNGAAPSPTASPQPAPGSEPALEAVPTPTPVDPLSPLEPEEGVTLLRLAWRTLVGRLTDHPIEDSDLAAYDLTPRLLSRRGCFVTLKKGGEVRGLQGEIDPTRPLYQQVIIFTRRAATRDPRFLPLTAQDLPDLLIRIEIIGPRQPINGPDELDLERQGIFLEKWGRRALFLPGIAAAQGWTASRTLDELCRQASLPAGAWAQGARLEAFTTQVVQGAQPPPPPPSPSPAPGGPGPMESPVPAAEPTPAGTDA
jgi:AmmeMemoRadiSam system protein A